MNLLSHFTEQCQRSPTQLACTEIDRALSYAQFNHAQQRLAAVLHQHECATHCIGVFIDRGIDAAIAIYAILSAGACYLPLDLKNPPERLHFIVQDAKPRLILGHGPCPAWLPTSELWLDITRLASPATAHPLPALGRARSLAPGRALRNSAQVRPSMRSWAWRRA